MICVSESWGFHIYKAGWIYVMMYNPCLIFYIYPIPLWGFDSFCTWVADCKGMGIHSLKRRVLFPGASGNVDNLKTRVSYIAIL